MMMVQSAAPDARKGPLLHQDILWMSLVCPTRMVLDLVVMTLYASMWLLRAVATKVPSGEKAAQYTSR